MLVPWAGHFQCYNINIFFIIKYTEAIFFKQHSETVMVLNYQNADCRLKKFFIVSFITIFGTLAFPIGLAY